MTDQDRDDRRSGERRAGDRRSGGDSNYTGPERRVADAASPLAEAAPAEAASETVAPPVARDGTNG